MRKYYLALLLLLLAGCSSKKDEVVVIEKTKSYHREDCARVMMADTKTMSKEDAVKINCHPCSDCKPDSLK